MSFFSSQSAYASVWQIPDLTPSEASQIVGWSFADSFYSGGEGSSRLRIQSQEENEETKELAVWDNCENFETKLCKDTKNKWTTASVILPRCINESTPWCIESLNIQRTGMKPNQTEFLRQVKGIKTPAYPDLGFPAGSTISLWKSTNIFNGGGTDTYAVYVMVRFVKLPGKLPSIVNMSATVLPYVEITEGMDSSNQKYYESQYLRDSQEDGSEKLQIIGGSKECAWTENRVCGLVAEFPKDVEVSLSMRVGNKLTGWFMGRLQNPAITTAILDKGQNLLKIKAYPVEVPKFYATVQKENLTPDLASTWMTDGWGTKNPQGVYVTKSNFADVFRILDKWKSVAQNKAAGSIRTWAFDSMLSGVGTKCFSNSNVILGFVTTNAMVYEGTAPNFKNGYLDFRVAGLHLNSDESVFEGTYDLVLRKSVAQCIYGFVDAPITATISIIKNDTEEKISNFKVSESGAGKEKWVKISASGFTFSSPMLRVKFYPKKTLNPTSIKSIICLKGQSLKKVTGISPKCPSGFTKK